MVLEWGVVAGMVLAAAPLPAGQGVAAVRVMTWNVCGGTNGACPLYRAGVHQLGWTAAKYALAGRSRVVFLQEFCTGADAALEKSLEELSGARWSVRSWGLRDAKGRPYACRPDYQGRERGTQSVVVAVQAGQAAFSEHELSSPPWFVRRAAVCADVPAWRLRACGTHLSSGMSNDDHQDGSPYRVKQVRELERAAREGGRRVVFGGDLNLTPHRAAITAVGARWRECDPRQRWTFTGKKIDYLFAPGMRECRVGAADAPSDHRPLYGEATLAEER
ncbi:endonuclease/exonuclease/phosphatase family protein [Nonomuraea sp. NPDC050310]|uniref:endonuclease/exonuclease/phosphatase family protein n=1 Tax=Nonomuraea sp. NPDC050310 TaxID=3154935 RepID=UPI0033D99226